MVTVGDVLNKCRLLNFINQFKLRRHGMPPHQLVLAVSDSRMKTTIHIFAFGLLMTFLSCGQPNDKTSIAASATDTLKTNRDKKEEVRLKKRRELEEQEYADSIRLNQVLQDAVKRANQNIGKNRFIEKYEVYPDSIPVRVEIDLDYHFTKASPHLIIRRNEPATFFIDIYTKGTNQFEKVLSYERWALEYGGDTIRDISGDGLKDFVVNWYGSTGCCLKAFSNVYLLRVDKTTFSGNFQFINPTFSPQEQIIRGVCYGHPGETEMYKFKWNKGAVDTIEYIYYEKNNNGEKTGKVIVSNSRPNSDKQKVLKRLNYIPAEYRKIEGFDWFTDNVGTKGNR